MKIMVIGGAGYIGSITNRLLKNQGFETVIFDSMEHGHEWAIKDERLIRGDLRNFAEINNAIASEKPDAVVHFAAYIQVGESVKEPTKYYHNNVGGSINLVRSLIQNNVKRMVFSSTAAVYGEPERMPISEDDKKQPTNPYGETKLAVERLLEWTAKAHDFKYVALRYFNACGAMTDGSLGEAHEPESHIIPVFLDKISKNEDITINGNDFPTVDGTCIRDYIHVMDLGEAHISALKYLDSNPSNSFNVGTGKGFSNKEIAEMAMDVTGKKVAINYGQRREGDPAELIANVEKIKKEMGFVAGYSDLKTVVESAWKWKNNSKQH
jgi:UDP-glucose 4-epimerase